MLIVIPYGKSPRFHSDTEWANASAGRYVDFVLDTVRAVDRRFATRPLPAGPAIAGYSEGGYGAMNVALHHLGTFCVAEAWSGYFVQTPTAAFTGARPGSARAQLARRLRPRSPPRLRRLPFPAYLYVGNPRRRDDRGSPGFAARLSVRRRARPGPPCSPASHLAALAGRDAGALTFASRHLRGY